MCKCELTQKEMKSNEKFRLRFYHCESVNCYVLACSLLRVKERFVALLSVAFGASVENCSVKFSNQKINLDIHTRTKFCIHSINLTAEEFLIDSFGPKCYLWTRS